MNWQVLTMAFKTPDGAIKVVQHVVIVINGDSLLITNGLIKGTDDIGNMRAEAEGWEYLGCRIENLNTEV